VAATVSDFQPDEFFGDADDVARRTLGTSFVSHTPSIQISHELEPMVMSACTALCTDPVTFQRGGQLVHIARVDADERRIQLPMGTPVIRPMSRATLRVRLSECVEWRKPVRGKPGDPPAFFNVRPDEAAVSAVHEQGEWNGMRVLVGISETPIVRPNGSIVQSSGYDDETGFVFVPSAEYPPIEPEPSQAEAQAALAELNDLFADFEFSTDEGHAVPIAAILTIIGRAGVDGSVPAFVIEAAVRGAGKTLCSDIISMVATGRSASRTTYPDDDDELRKVLDGYALQGAAFISMDNVARPLGGAALDAFLTARDEVTVRELGRTGQKSVPWRSTVLATGNNISIRGDTGRRVLFARLEPTAERPEDRTNFQHTDLVGYTRENRPRLVAAALTILRAYAVAGRPDVLGATWGSFEGWTALIPAAIRFAGGPNVLNARLGNTDDVRDSEFATLRTLLGGIAMLAGKETLRARDVLAALWPPGRDQHSSPDGYDDLRDAVESITRSKPGRPPSSRQLADALRGLRGRWIGGQRLFGEPGAKGVTKWGIEATAAS
jgi:hypothetical protein